MGNSLFGRKAVVTVGPAGGNGVRLEGLHMTFKVEKTLGASSNKAKIVIYNLAKTSRSLMTQGNARIIVEAGTGRSTGVVFSGDIVDAKTTISGQDTVTEIDAADGHVAINEVNVEKNYPGGTNYRTIMEDLAGEMISGGAVALGVIEADQAGRTQNGIIVSGPAGKALARIAKEQGLTASVQDGHVVVVDRAAGQSEQGVVLSAATGMSGTPRKTKEGIAVDALIMGAAFNPGRRIRIVSDDLTGNYTIQKVTIDGSVIGGSWTTKIEAA